MTKISASEIISVSRLNFLINHSLSINYPVIKVEGEISQLIISKMGHTYFTLKDAESCVKCVLFRSDSKRLSFPPTNGDQIVVIASPTVYSTRGDFQLKVSEIIKAGKGELFEKYLRLKQKLTTEGLFDSVHKLEIPNFFNCVGIVTSLESAALRDALVTFHNKLARVKLKIFPSTVQGENASSELIAALNIASQDSEIQIILLLRGGGSLEDLWTFNEENLVRALTKIKKPIVAGIGHESDTTLCDLVADWRAATPTAAVERLVLEEKKLIDKFEKNKINLIRLIKSFLEEREQKLDYISLSLKSPRDKLALNENKFLNTQRRLVNVKKNMVKELYLSFKHLKNKIDILDPSGILKRGYCILYENNSVKVISTINQIKKGKTLDVQLFDGNAKVNVNNVEKKL